MRAAFFFSSSIFCCAGQFVVALTALVNLTSCQTSRAVTFAYNDATYGGEHYKSSDRTSVLFLMDGLSTEMLRTSLQTSNVPNISDAFTLSTKARFAVGRAAFPSLTFPNIASILTGHPVSEHSVTGNRVMIDDKIVNFESVTNWEQLALTLQRRTIFYKLAEDSQSSVSYSYAFSGGATAYQTTSAAAAAGYLESDYVSIDTQTLTSLKTLLLSTQLSKWPRFIFVHIVGIDATAHSNGPFDKSVQAYIHAIDAQLREVFQILDHPNGQAASTREINYAMTADHGFRATPDHSPLEDVVAHMKRKIQIISDNRTAPLFLKEDMSADEKMKLAQALLLVPHVGWAVVKTEDGVELLKRSGARGRISIAKKKCPSGESAARFEWFPNADSKTAAPSLSTSQHFNCLSEFDLVTGADDDSYIVPALVDYFQAPHAPDMIFIPDDHSDFAEGYAGNHGGLSRDEMLVPVLTKGFDVQRGIRPTFDILRTMGVK